MSLTRWLEEIDRKQAEIVATQIALEKHRQRDQLLETENEMLKVAILSILEKDMVLVKSGFFFFFLALLSLIYVAGECKS